MLKNSTPLNKSDLLNKKQLSIGTLDIQPSTETLKRILQFASTYKAQKINENQYVELFLN